MPTAATSRSVAAIGIDVGGRNKGFHAVALLEDNRVQTFESADPKALTAWCAKQDPRAIGIDAPCAWSTTGRARAAERALMAKGVWCFSTPRRETAETHPKDYYRWMLNGAELYDALSEICSFFIPSSSSKAHSMMFETFPHAIACALQGSVVVGGKKAATRRKLLRISGIDPGPLKNIDFVDAALCALTARLLTAGEVTWYGDANEGYIVVPACALPPS